ncbi:hypothetical protein R50073_23860 [Maricurvus nonylphenolicus]
MVNIGPTVPPTISTKAANKTKTRPVSVGISKQLSQKSFDPVSDRRKKDRRHKSEKPLVDMRSGRDRRRNNPDQPSIDTSV